MAALAFKAISYGAEQIPDKVFEKIPGGFFTPAEKKKIDKDRKDRKDRKDTQHKDRYRSEERPSKRSSRRERSPVTDQSDYSAYDDTDYERERERRKRERRRAKSAGRTSSRSLSRGRRNRHSSALYGHHSDPRDMALPGQGQPYFPPPPTSEYRPYNPQEYAPSPGPDHRPSATPAYEYGYSPQVNRLSSFRRATLATMPEHPTPVNSCPPMLRSRTTSNASSPFSFQPRFLDTLQFPLLSLLLTNRLLRPCSIAHSLTLRSQQQRSRTLLRPPMGSASLIPHPQHDTLLGLDIPHHL
jgi:hypothetical protein